MIDYQFSVDPSNDDNNKIVMFQSIPVVIFEPCICYWLDLHDSAYITGIHGGDGGVEY